MSNPIMSKGDNRGVMKAEALKCDLHISPAEIMSDFELPLMQSFELQFPGALFMVATFILHSVCGEK